MRKIIIIQHCQSEHHINNMSGGWTDTPLTELGRQQANLLGERLKDELAGEEYTMYSSDLKRAYQTAEIVGEHLGLDINVEEDLREINTGICAGKTKEWVKEHQIPMKDDKFDIDHLSFPEGETFRQFNNRVVACMDKILDSDNGNLIIVTHGGTLTNIVHWWMKSDQEMMNEAFYKASPGSISILITSIYKGQRALAKLNDTAHLMFLGKSE